MNARDFRRIALTLGGVVEQSHMGHPDFRAHGRIFASLKTDERHAAVKLAPDEQLEFIARDSDSFQPESGAWGRQGWTRITLESVAEEDLGEALTLASRHLSTAPVKPVRHSKRSSGAKRRRS
ncbi:MAG: MmcQ/YjbR family DNA-binding protein [Vicinamibacterales bacterium]